MERNVSFCETRKTAEDRWIFGSAFSFELSKGGRKEFPKVHVARVSIFF